MVGRLCFKKPGPALKDYYGQRPFTVKEEMKKEKKTKDRMNFGVAFIVMDQLSSVEGLIKNLKPLKKKFKQLNPYLYNRLDAQVSNILVLELVSYYELIELDHGDSTLPF